MYVWVNIGPGNGLVLEGTKPIHEPVLRFCDVHQRAISQGAKVTIFFYNSGLKIILLKYGSIGSDNGLACHLFQHQAII